ncbi:MAG: NTPase [Acidilobaceae archaeon]
MANSYFITGAPGVGKSTIFMEIVRNLKNLGCIVGGIYAPEVRTRGLREGFQIVDIENNARGWLARVGAPGRLRIGKYTVVVDDVLKVGVPALEKAIKNAHVIAIDEIGPMELLVPQLKESIIKGLTCSKPIVAVIHRKLSSINPEIYDIILSLGPIVEVTIDNRSILLRQAGKVALSIAREAGCSK